MLNFNRVENLHEQIFSVLLSSFQEIVLLELNKDYDERCKNCEYLKVLKSDSFKFQ